MTTAARITAQDWGWRYASRRSWAARGVTLSIAPGERVLLLGASGAGKSTLLHGLGGVLGGADEGETEGALLVDEIPADRAHGRVGMVLQDPDTQTIMTTVGDDVAFGLENLGVPREQIWSRVASALDAVGLDLPLGRATSALSGGQKQRLALAGVLAMQPGAILLDEPTANLDPAGAVQVRDAVARIVADRQTTLVVIEHRIDNWIELIDRVIVVGRQGEDTGIIADGTPDEVLRERGAELAQAGVWVPGHPPVLPSPPARSAGAYVLRAKGITVSRRKGVPVAGPIDLDLRSGEVVGIVGPNGAGKSTLALTIAGLIPAESGTITVDGELSGTLTHRDPLRWSSRDLLTRIGTVLQEPEHQLMAKTVRDELAIGPRALKLPVQEIEERVAGLLDHLRLAALAPANPFTLSGGEKRRLTVGGMLATRPKVIVLDEPTFGQDAVTWSEIVALLAELRDAGHAVLIVTHDEQVLSALHARRVELGVSSPTASGGSRTS